MQPMFDTLLKLMKEPLRTGAGVKTDDSILLVYPPDKEPAAAAAPAPSWDEIRARAKADGEAAREKRSKLEKGAA